MLPARYSSTQVSSVITITGLGDHDQPDWLITMTGIRTQPSRPGEFHPEPLTEPDVNLSIHPARATL